MNERVPKGAGLRFRLPTEAEWERACRAGELSGQERAPELEAIAWYRGNSGGQTQPVGLKQPNRYGLHDMLGNVWEWCEDSAETHAPYRYTTERAIDPVHRQGSYRVDRGGSWRGDAGFVRAAFRNALARDYRNDNLGFRLAGGQESAPR